MVKKPLANAGDIRDVGLIPGLGSSPGVTNDNPLHYSCLWNLTDKGAWGTTVHRAAKSQTQLKRLSTEITDFLMGCPSSNIQREPLSEESLSQTSSTHTPQVHLYELRGAHSNFSRRDRCVGEQLRGGK